MKRSATLLLLLMLLVVMAATALAQEGDEQLFFPLINGGGQNGGDPTTPTVEMTATLTDGEATRVTPQGTAMPTNTKTAAPTATTDPNATPTPITGTPGSTVTPVNVPGSPTPINTPTPVPDCTQYGAGKVRSSRFGVQMYEDTQPSVKYFSALVDSSAGWLRVIAPWGPTEPVNTTPENYRWTRLDTELGAAAHLNVHVIGTIGFAPSWAASNTNGILDKATVADLTEFVGALVERYDGDGVDDAPCSPVVNHWEFYNEPDRTATQSVGYYRNSFGDHPAEYFEILKASYPVVKAANPAAQVLFGGIAYEWFTDEGGRFARDFTDRVLQMGGGAYFDIMSFHVYPEFWRVHAEQSPGLLEKTNVIRDLLARNGVDKPLYITETGSHSNSAASFEMTEELQARYVPQLFAQTIASGADVAIWFMLYDTPDGTYPYKNGLVTDGDPPRRKLSFDAYTYAVNRFKDAEYVRTLTLEERGREDLLAYAFRATSDGHIFYVAWRNPVNTQQTSDLRIAADYVTTRDLYGSGRTVLDADDGVQDGYVTIKVGGQPVYILER